MSTETPNSSERATEAVGGQSTTPEVEPWEGIGRTLLRARLERVAEEVVRDAFRQTTSRIADGDALTEADISEMRHAIEEAKRAVDLAATASPETAPAPDLGDFLTEEDKRAYIEEIDRRRGD